MIFWLVNRRGGFEQNFGPELTAGDALGTVGIDFCKGGAVNSRDDLYVYILCWDLWGWPQGREREWIRSLQAWDVGP